MRVFLTFILIYSGFAFSLEIKIKNNPNLRSTANFLGQTNVVGSIKAGASAHVIEEKTLPSGNKAYKISLASIKPQTSFSEHPPIFH